MPLCQIVMTVSPACLPGRWWVLPACAARRRSANAIPQLRVDWLRGNVNTRLGKLDDGQYDAIILAASGLQRLGFNARIKAAIAPEECLPAVGQGVLGIEIRSDDAELRALIEPLAHAETTLRVRAERAFNQTLNGGCQVPIAGLCRA